MVFGWEGVKVWFLTSVGFLCLLKKKYWNFWDPLKLAQVPTIQVSIPFSRTSALWSCYFKRLTVYKAYTWKVHVSCKSYTSVSGKMLPPEFWHQWRHCRGIILQLVLSTIMVVRIFMAILILWVFMGMPKQKCLWAFISMRAALMFVIWLSQFLGSSWSWLHSLPQHRQRGAGTVPMMKA